MVLVQLFTKLIVFVEAVSTDYRYIYVNLRNKIFGISRKNYFAAYEYRLMSRFSKLNLD